MVHGSPHNRPVYIHNSPHATVPLVPQYILPDGRVVYSNPGTPTQPVIYQAPAAAALPPLSMPPGHIVMPAQPAPQPLVHTCVPYCAEHAGQKLATVCAQCPAPADNSLCPACKPASGSGAPATKCTVPGCKQCPPAGGPSTSSKPHEVVVASATRMEAENWVARILGFDMDYLRTLPPEEFQEKINTALAKAQEKPREPTMTCNCPVFLHAHSISACAPRAQAHRHETEAWLQRMMGIPRYVSRQWTMNQLNAFVNSTLAGFQRRS